MKFNQLRKRLQVRFKKFDRKRLIIIGLVLAGGLLLYQLKGLFVAALVNGQPVTRFSVLKELEKQGGSQTLDNLIVKALIFQEARKKGISVSQENIDTELARLTEIVSQQGMSLEEALTLQNQSKKDLVDQIKIQKTVEIILADKVVVTEAEVQDYFEKNKDLYEAGAKLDAVSMEIRNKLSQSKLNSAYQSWITDLKANASINHFVNF